MFEQLGFWYSAAVSSLHSCNVSLTNCPLAVIGLLETPTEGTLEQLQNSARCALDRFPALVGETDKVGHSRHIRMYQPYATQSIISV